MSYLVLDLETGSKELYKRKGNPWFNRILAVGLKPEGGAVIAIPASTDKGDVQLRLHNFDLLIGHNIKYDLLYLWNDIALRNFLAGGGRIWDTQLAEYIITGQQAKFSALRKLAVEKYGQPEREKHIETLFEQGLETTEMPIELLIADVKNDVLDTEAIYLQQLELAKKSGQLKLIELQMDGLLATTEMEYNGMFVDRQALKKNAEELTKVKDETLRALKKAILPIWPNTLEFNPQSNEHISLLVFGGEYHESAREQIGNYKNGKPKFKNIEIARRVEGLKATPSFGSETKRKGIYKTDSETLESLPNSTSIELLLKYKDVNKQLSTYFTPIEELIYATDNCIHGQLSHCGYSDTGGGTVTGRLSSANPNLQNIPREGSSTAKQHFTSRFGASGTIIEADYKQLEIVVQAQLSRDKKYISDVNQGIDFHIKRLAMKEKMDYTLCVEKCATDKEWSKKRTQIKGFSFARAYGAGAKKIAEQTGMTVEEVKQMIIDEDLEYPQLKSYNNLLYSVVKENAERTERSTKEGRRIYTGSYQAPTGRKYYFDGTYQRNPFRLKEPETLQFRPSQTQNAIVQGTATADIVLIMLGKFWREVAQHNKDKFKLINTVHDSILIDSKSESVEEVKGWLEEVLTKVPETMEKEFGMKWLVPVGIDMKTGTNWGSTK
jgi:DNA polymerase-1